MQLHISPTDFYSTNGITPPLQLTPLSTPNYSESYLLPPDPVEDEQPNLTIYQ